MNKLERLLLAIFSRQSDISRAYPCGARVVLCYMGKLLTLLANFLKNFYRERTLQLILPPH
jgi:hypothetical protein